MPKGVSFNNPGFANSLVLRIGLLILFALSVFVFAVYLLIGRQTVEHLATSQMELAAEQLEARYSRLLKTVEVTLRSSQAWSRSATLDQNALLRFNEFFFPIIYQQGEISSVLFAHEDGRELLLRLDQDGRWLNRLSNPAQWGNKTYWVTWNSARQIERVEMREQAFDARQRPWFKGAMALADDSQIYWSDPYVFFTTKAIGITASMRWQGPDGSRYVIAHDVKLANVTEFTTRTHFGTQGKVAVMLADGRLLAPPSDPRFKDAAAINTALLKPLAELDLPAFSEGLATWQADPHANAAPHLHQGGDGKWFSLFRPLEGGIRDVWLGVVAPRSDFEPISRQDIVLFGLIGLTVIGLGIAVAIRIARRFGEPLQALAADSARIGALELDHPVSTNAPWREVTHLANALEEMRRHLQRTRQAVRETQANLEQMVAIRTHELEASQDALTQREAFFRAIFDNAAVGIVSLDADLRPTMINRAFSRFTGIPIDEALIRKTQIGFSPALVDWITALSQQNGAGAHGDPRQEFPFSDRHGAQSWGDVQAAAIRKADGAVDSILVTVLDITDRRHIQSELIRQFSFQQALIDTIPNPIFYKGADTRFLGCNRAYESFFGINRREFIGKRVLDLAYLPLDARQAYQTEDEGVIRERTQVSREVQLSDAQGVIHDTLYSVSGFSAPDGSPGGLIGIIVDISPLKAAERDAEHARAIAESAAAAKADFLANMSHEIRTPMNAIVGMTQLALQTELSARQHNYLSKVENAAKGLLGIINDILDLSKIDAGMMRFERSEFSLDSCLRHLSDLCALRASERGLELLYDVAPEVPDQLIGDALRLGQVLLNLVGNAIKFTDVGEVVVRVRVADLAPDRITLDFAVADTGIGMNEAQRSRLFTAFTQGDSSTTRKYGGTGLGLSICKRIVDLQGGDIDVESTPGHGSVFRFRLAFDLPDPTPGMSAPQRIGLPEQVHALVVDDNQGARDILSQMLATMAIPCTTVASGDAALAELRAASTAGRPYDLAIIDWRMPVMDGIALVRAIRAGASGGTQLAIIMATAHDRMALETALGDLPISAILGKPATPSSLFDSIMVALHRQPAAARDTALALRHRRFPGQRVLLVEDNDVNRELAFEFLENFGLTVETAEHGQEALAILQTTPVDLILMDCQMPVMDGYAATREIRRNRAWQNLPIIAMTANALVGDRERCLAAGMNDHLPKPIDVAVLWSMLARWLGEPDDTTLHAFSSTPSALTPATRQSTRELDRTTAQERMGGNPVLYQRMLRRFHDNQKDVGNALRTHLQDGDWAAMGLKAHTLRGLAGTIGATHLSELAGNLELLLKSGSPDEARISRLLDEIGSAISIVMAEIVPTPTETEAFVPPRDHDEALSELQFLLDNDDVAAVGRFEEMSGWLRDAYDRFQIEELAKYIAQYAFEDASRIVQKLRLMTRA